MRFDWKDDVEDTPPEQIVSIAPSPIDGLTRDQVIAREFDTPSMQTDTFRNELQGSMTAASLPGSSPGREDWYQGLINNDVHVEQIARPSECYFAVVDDEEGIIVGIAIKDAWDNVREVHGSGNTPFIYELEHGSYKFHELQEMILESPFQDINLTRGYLTGLGFEESVAFKRAFFAGHE